MQQIDRHMLVFHLIEPVRAQFQEALTHVAEDSSLGAYFLLDGLPAIGKLSDSQLQLLYLAHFGEVVEVTNSEPRYASAEDFLSPLIAPWRETFQSPYDQHAEHVGKGFKVVTWGFPDGEEAGVLYRIRLEDGSEIEAWPEEVQVGVSDFD